MRNAFYAGVAEDEVHAPVGERRQGVTLEEMKRELVGVVMIGSVL